jgi:hypothetical protein
MADTGIIDLDTGVMVEKRGHGRPRGSKNKPKEASMAVSSSSVLVKRRPGHPLGSKNKPKPSASLANRPLDAPTAHHNTPPPSSSNIFSFFLLSLVLNVAILREESGEGSPYEVEVYYDGDGEMFFMGGWPHFAEDYDLHQGWFCCSTINVAL